MEERDNAKLQSLSPRTHMRPAGPSEPAGRSGGGGDHGGKWTEWRGVPGLHLVGVGSSCCSGTHGGMEAEARRGVRITGVSDPRGGGGE